MNNLSGRLGTVKYIGGEYDCQRTGEKLGELLWETILEQQFIAVQIEQLREDRKFTLDILAKH